MRFKFITLYFVPITALVFLPIVAQADQYVAESDFFGESPVVLTASRLHKPLAESPVSISVIDREMIRNSGARQIADIFRMVPGFIVGYLHGYTPSVTYNGLGSEFTRNMQVLIDGRSVFIPSFGGIPWSNLPLLIDDIERIEITRGPNAVTYGSNAFLATINIITRHSAEDLGGQVSATHDLDEDSTTQDFYFRYGNQYKDLDWRISAGREKDQGYPDTQTFDELDDKTLEKVNIRADFLSSHNHFWTFQAGGNQSAFGRGDGDPTDIYRTAEIQNSYQNIKWEIIEDDVQTTLKLTHTSQKVDDQFTTEPLDSTNFALPPGLIVNTDISFNRDSDRLDFEIYQNRILTPSLTMNYGGSVRKDSVKSVYLFYDNNEYKVDTTNLFTSIELKPWHSFTLDFGAIVEDNNYSDKESSFRLSAIQNLGAHNLRFVSSSAKRYPVLWELMGNISFDATVLPGTQPPYDAYIGAVIQPASTAWSNQGDVEPESILSNEIGLFSQYLDNQLTTDIKLFSYKISDQLTEVTITIPPTLIGDNVAESMANGGETTVDGFEFSFNYSPKPKDFRVYGGLSLIHNQSFNPEYSASIPERSGFIGGHYDFYPRHQISPSLYYVDEMSWTDRSSTIESYYKLDLRYEYSFGSKHDVKVELTGYNLMEDFSDYRSSKTHDKSLLLSISGRF